MRTCSLSLLLTALAAQAELPAGYQFQLQARTNLLVNDNGFNLPPGASFNSIGADINATRQVAFRVQIVPGTNANGLWFGSNGAGSLVCFSENTSDAVLSDPSLNGSGVMVFKQAFGTLNGIYRCDPASPPAVRLTTGPLGTTDWGTPLLNDAGQIAFRAGFNGPQAWVSRAVDTSFAAHLADSAAQVGSPYNFLFSPAFTQDRRMVGLARLAAAAPNPEFVELVSANTSGAVTSLLRVRAGDPNSPVQSFDSTSPAAAHGFVALSGTAVGGARALWRLRMDGTELTEIARVGVNGVTAIDFFGPAVDGAGNVVFRGRDAVGRALFVGNGSTLRRIVGQSSLIDTDRGLAQVGQNTTADEIFSGRPNVNAAGDIAFVAALHPFGNNQVEWGTGVFVARVQPENIFASGFQ
jgi:hypothetical protein